MSETGIPVLTSVSCDLALKGLNSDRTNNSSASSNLIGSGHSKNRAA